MILTQFWNTASLEYRVVFSGVEIPLLIEPEDDGTLSPAQQEAVRIARSLPPDVLETAAPAVVQNYDIYWEALGDELPAPAAPVDVWKQVHPTSLDVQPHHGFPIPTFPLRAECDWDPEHGLEVRFLNGLADAANQQGEL